nr:hypothetical protein [Tanacetum cinerariifolium]
YENKSVTSEKLAEKLLRAIVCISCFQDKILSLNKPLYLEKQHVVTHGSKEEIGIQGLKKKLLKEGDGDEVEVH